MIEFAMLNYNIFLLIVQSTTIIKLLAICNSL